MKRLLLAFLFVVLLSSIALAAAPFHIGIMTGTVSQQEDELRGAERLIKEYGDVSDGGMISHLTWPDNFMAEMETTISQIASFADDPLMKAIVVQSSVPGTVEGFRRVRELRPDILLFAGTPQEDPVMIAEVADLCVSSDKLSRGYLIVLGAKKLGADTFVHISFPRHMSNELNSRRRDIMAETCKDLGLKFGNIGAPDPTSEIGVAGAQQYIIEKVPAWIEKYGKNTAFFTTNDALDEPLIRQVAKFGAIYVEATYASPTMGYPGALGIEFEEADKGNWPRILKKVEDAVLETGNGGRMGCWAFSYAYCVAAGLGEHAKRVIEGKSELLNKDDILDAFGKYSPGAQWNSSYYVDANDVVRKNFLLVYQDTYIFGRGYLHQTSEVIPEKYYDRNIGKK
ncbi:MAG TPA: DUF3798 domain-containing protein [Atribacterota bacterium]|nr:DUF3798 domain-containing protein [Atribacterota bacterium]